jgi:aryl-alcohol dehydrogenase-like predicted oxidoreductase
MEATKLSVGKISLSSLGIGTWAWGDRLFWDYGSNYGEAEVEKAFEAAITGGVTFFDTAEVYGLGESERLLGKFLQQTTQPVQIATKYFPVPWRWNKKAMADALTASLQRLKLT